MEDEIKEDAVQRLAAENANLRMQLHAAEDRVRALEHAKLRGEAAENSVVSHAVEILRGDIDHHTATTYRAAASKLVEIYEAKRNKVETLILQVSKQETENAKLRTDIRHLQNQLHTSLEQLNSLLNEIEPLRDFEQRWAVLDKEPPGVSAEKARVYSEMAKRYRDNFDRTMRGMTAIITQVAKDRTERDSLLELLHRYGKEPPHDEKPRGRFPEGTKLEDLGGVNPGIGIINLAAIQKLELYKEDPDGKQDP